MKHVLFPSVATQLTFAQSLLGCSMDIIHNKCREAELTDCSSVLSIADCQLIEIRLENVTLTCHFEDLNICNANYLFFDEYKYIYDLSSYILFCDKHYCHFDSYRWVNRDDSVEIQIVQERYVGNVIVCRKSGILS